MPPERLEHLTYETIRGPVGEADSTTRPAYPNHFLGSSSLVRREHHPERRYHGVETRVCKRQGFGIRNLEIHIEAFCIRPFLASFEQGAYIVGRGHDASATGGRQGHIAIAGGHIKDPFVTTQITRLGEKFPDNLQSRADDGVVSAGPSGHLAGLQGIQVGWCIHGGFHLVVEFFGSNVSGRPVVLR
jgi:hypothetical protein